MTALRILPPCDDPLVAMAKEIAAAQAEARKFDKLSNPLPRSQVPQFVRSLDALLSLPRMRKHMKELEG